MDTCGTAPLPSKSPRVTANLLANAETTPWQQAAVDKRVTWLEEDLVMLHRRFCEEANNSSGDELGMRQLVAGLKQEIALERTSRETLEHRVARLEDAIAGERQERDAQLREFSGELEASMRGLTGRLDEGLSAGAAAMRERSDAIETRLKGLIRRVDEGLSAGAAALQDTLSVSRSLPVSRADVQSEFSRVKHSSPTRATLPKASRKAVVPACEVHLEGGSDAGNMLQSWKQLQQENRRLVERQAQLRMQLAATSKSSSDARSTVTAPATDGAPRLTAKTPSVVRNSKSGGPWPSPSHSGSASR